MTEYKRNLPHLRLPPPIRIRISFFNPPEERLIELSESDIKLLRKSQIIGQDAYVLLAIWASFSHKNPSISVSCFCEIWNLSQEQFLTSAIKLRRSNIEFEVVPKPEWWDAELAKEFPQPQPGDVVLGGQDA